MNRNSGAIFSDDAIRLPQDGWPSDCLLTATAIRDADPDAAPPEIRTVSGDTVFVPSLQRAELERFCATHEIRLTRRPDVWGSLLEPFLDTSFTAEQQAGTIERLARAGLAAAEVARIRGQVGPLMLAYNSVHWDWHHLGLADLLDAACGSVVPEHLRIGPTDRAAFHAWAMEIADRPNSA
ncbi:hypothetical protein [Streptomyces sp. NBC_01296]|uniref:hypothetical protein n=1 Tax=Streptomyces sp. NBC_01296 TaxID=2903816 RepID=UPI002E128337|nr:hypothetical protein OG299_37800 [Streptomyces sp. NBC_01296]